MRASRPASLLNVKGVDGAVGVGCGAGMRVAVREGVESAAAKPVGAGTEDRGCVSVGAGGGDGETVGDGDREASRDELVVRVRSTTEVADSETVLAAGGGSSATCGSQETRSSAGTARPGSDRAACHRRSRFCRASRYPIRNMNASCRPQPWLIGNRRATRVGRQA